jgi:hypothetical protein
MYIMSIRRRRFLALRRRARAFTRKRRATLAGQQDFSFYARAA